MVFMPIRGAQLSLRRFLLQFGDIAWNWVYCSLKLHANIKWRCKKPMHKSCSKNIIVFRNFINIIFDTMNFVLYYLRLIVLFLCCNIQFSLKERRCKILENTRKMSQGCTILEMVKFVQTSFCEIWKVFHSTRLWLCNIHSKLITEWQSLNGLLSQTNHESDLFQIYSPKNFLGE